MVYKDIIGSKAVEYFKTLTSYLETLPGNFSTIEECVGKMVCHLSAFFQE